MDHPRPPQAPEKASPLLARAALRFVVLMGVVSLFADMTYEGARSLNGSYLAVLGASGALVGLVAGAGELIGYALRFFSGLLSDKTHRYWAITFIGYAVNLFAVPLLALTGNWQTAAALMMLERVGKAIRVPPRDAMLSYGTQHMGRGWGFGLHEALDQIGAVSGPLIVAAALHFGAGYRFSYALLLVPVVLAMATLTAARWLYPRPQDLEIRAPQLQTQGFTRAFWLYILGACLIAAGFADFPLIAYHFERTALIAPAAAPLLYALAMGVDALAALVFGRLFDRLGIVVMMLVAALSAGFAPLVFLGGVNAAVAGMVLWGIGMGAQESIMRAAVGSLAAPERRSYAYGVFNAGYGVFWFLGSLLIGVLYDISLPALVAFSVTAQLAALPIFYAIRKQV